MKPRLLIAAILVTILLYATTSLSAQDASSPQFSCDLPTLQKAIDVYIGELGKLKDSKESDIKKISNTLQEMANVANIMRSTCDELSFSGKKQTVIGPVEIPKGSYRVTLTTASSGHIDVQLNPNSGECGEGAGSFTSPLLYNFSDENAKDGAEVLVTSNGCIAIISVNIDTTPWTLKFERLTTD